MLNNTLNGGEIKNTAGTGETFEEVNRVDGRRIFRNTAYVASQPCEFVIGHQEIGSGIQLRRRSLLRFARTIPGLVDTTVPMTASIQIVLDSPIGNLVSDSLPKEVIAHAMSFLASDGIGGTTIVYACTGKGALTLLQGTF